MGFEVVEGSPRSLWVPIADLDTIYVGQLVEMQTGTGVAPLGTAAGANDTTNKSIPFGVVIGTNLKTPAFNTTYNADAITDVSPLNSTVEYVMHEGPWSRGDKVAMVEVAVIDEDTVLKGPLNNAAVGVAPTLLTVTTGGTVSATTNATDVAGVANLATLYCRTGVNAGAYRITSDTSTTALTWGKATTNAIAIGDTAVRVNGLRVAGPSRAQFDTESMYIDVAAANTANYYGVDVIKLDLREANKEHVFFKFNVDHFAGTRA